MSIKNMQGVSATLITEAQERYKNFLESGDDRYISNSDKDLNPPKGNQKQIDKNTDRLSEVDKKHKSIDYIDLSSIDTLNNFSFHIGMDLYSFIDEKHAFIKDLQYYKNGKIKKIEILLSDGTSKWINANYLLSEYIVVLNT